MVNLLITGHNHAVDSSINNLKIVIHSSIIASVVERRCQSSSSNHLSVFREISKMFGIKIVPTNALTTVYLLTLPDQLVQYMNTCINLLVSHRTPVYPATQLHVYPFTASTHDPPFTHGLLAHSFISTN